MKKKNEIGLRIRTMRMSRKMTQIDLAKAINQSQSSITMYETGRREPDFETLEALADVFNVPLASLVASDDLETPVYYLDKPKIDPYIHLVSGMMENMTKEQKEQIVAIIRAVVPTGIHPNTRITIYYITI